jgi:cytochrome P450
MDQVMDKPAERPAHVPPELVYDLDFYNPAGLPDPHSDVDLHAVWKKVQGETPDFFWTPRNGGHWVVTRAEAIEQVQRNWEVFSHKSLQIPPSPLPSLPLETDPPEHTPLRALLSPLFAPATLLDVEKRARELTKELIDGFIADGRCEFSSQFARQLPIQIFLYLVDLPAADAPYLLDLAEGRVRSPDPEVRHKVKVELIGYLGDKIEQRRKNPGEDFISRVLQGDMGGRTLTDFEAQNILATLMFGGLDTVASMLGFAFRFLAGSPHHRKQLVDDPKLIPKAVNELIRRHGLTNTGRIIDHDAEVMGVKFKKGDRIIVPSALAGLDERVFPDPMTVDFNRPNASAHAAFGNGPHRCPGANLARMEMKVVLEEWMPRIPDFRIDPNDRLVMTPGLVSGVTYLPLVWDV